ncbi:hypothetical protein GGX14DRAFT_368453, partial [Mycena pura]
EREQIRREWAREVKEHELIRQEWEDELKRKHEEEDRVRAGFFWEQPRGNPQCLRHGARGWTARIANVPRTYDPVTACMETSVEIHGVRHPSPAHCEDRGCGGVFGHWVVNYSEPMCFTHFDNFKDKGCTSPGSRRRRIESPLENLQPGEYANDNWREMCMTTGADFRNLHFDSPGWCENWGKYGAWGIWEIEDYGCQ